jgi:hypothetical protein
VVSSKIAKRCTDVVAPVLAPGEQIQTFEVVQIGKVSAKRQITTAAVAGIASGGLLMVATRPRPYLMVLTGQRIMLGDFANTNVGKEAVFEGPPGRVTMGRA